MSWETGEDVPSCLQRGSRRPGAGGQREAGSLSSRLLCWDKGPEQGSQGVAPMVRLTRPSKNEMLLSVKEDSSPKTVGSKRCVFTSLFIAEALIKYLGTLHAATPWF